MRVNILSSITTWKALVMGLLIAVVATVATIVVLGSTGCTLIESCGDSEREYCVKNDCICGKSCARQNCDDDQICVSYKYEESHGVCVPPQYANYYGLEPLNPDGVVIVVE